MIASTVAAEATPRARCRRSFPTGRAAYPIPLLGRCQPTPSECRRACRSSRPPAGWAPTASARAIPPTNMRSATSQASRRGCTTRHTAIPNPAATSSCHPAPASVDGPQRRREQPGVPSVTLARSTPPPDGCRFTMKERCRCGGRWVPVTLSVLPDATVATQLPDRRDTPTRSAFASPTRRRRRNDGCAPAGTDCKFRRDEQAGWPQLGHRRFRDRPRD